MTAARPYIVVTTAVDLDALSRAIDVTEAAAVLLEPAEGRALDASSARPILERVQAKGAALLISADASLARTLRADGVHLPWGKDTAARYAEAREILGGRYIVGADAGRSRHDAMTLGEAGADYVGFGIPAHVEDKDTARERRLELVSWWSEIFEIPGVALDVETTEDAAALAGTGVDFIAMRLPAAPEDFARDLASALSLREDVA